MLFSTYRTMTWTLGFLSAAIIGVVFSFISPTLGLVAGIVFLLFVVVVSWLWLAQIRSRMADYGGAIPMPGWWGVMGVDIVDDDQRPAESPAPWVPSGAPDADRSGVSLADRKCPYCGAVLAKADARFCNDCGRRLPGPDLASIPTLPEF